MQFVFCICVQNLHICAVFSFQIVLQYLAVYIKLLMSTIHIEKFTRNRKFSPVIRGPALDYCYRSVARQPTGENTPVPANRSKTVAVTLRPFRSIVTAPLCHLSWRGSGVNQLSRFSCHPFSLHPTRKRTQMTALPAISPCKRMQSSDYTRPNQCVRVASPPQQPQPLPAGLKAFLFDGVSSLWRSLLGQMNNCACVFVSVFFRPSVDIFLNFGSFCLQVFLCYYCKHCSFRWTEIIREGKIICLTSVYMHIFNLLRFYH